AALNFAKPRNAEEKIDVFAQRALFEFRQLRLFQDRKANLLVQPLTTKNGGYLPGYLVVKNLWHQLVFNRGVTPLLDTDLFLLYLRTFIYDDLGFVDVLLSPEHSLKPNQEGDSSQAIADYFFTRISECSQLTTKEVASRVEAAILNGGASYYDDVQVGTSPEQARRGKKRFEDLLADFESGSADKTEELLRLREYQIRIIKQRRFICIASFAAPVEVNEKGRVLVGQQIGRDGQTRPLFGLSGRSGLRQAKGSGSVECFLCARPRLSVMTVNLQDEVVAVFSLSEAFDAALAAEVGEMRASLSDALKRKELFAEYLDIALAEPELAHWRKAYANAYEVGIENFYIDKALSRTPEECVETCASTMRETGFYKVLGEDYELVNTFARFSLNSSLARGARALLKDLTDPDHWDFDQLVNEIKTRGLNAHFPLLVDLEDKILFSLV
ncbi:MAG TPA: hypothetical protein VKD23_22130, partial [Terriglobales bacterium]|nr:hypothetical protein [Terriglobales bacterium]